MASLRRLVQKSPEKNQGGKQKSLEQPSDPRFFGPLGILSKPNEAD